MAAEYARKGRVLAAFRGHFTRTIAGLARAVAWADLQPAATSWAVTSVTRAMEAVERQFVEVERESNEIIALPADGGPTAEICTDLANRVTAAALLLETAREDAGTAIMRHEVADAVPAAAAAPPLPVDGAGAGLPRTIKPNTALKPEKLTRDHTPVEFRVWRNAFNAYYASSRMDASDLLTQRAYFYASLDSPLVAAVEAQVQEGTPIYQGAAVVQPNGMNVFEPSCMSILEDIFQLAYPLHSRRLAFFRNQPSSGQSFISWYDQLRLLGDEAELEALEVEDIYVMRCLVAAANQPKLREKFMELDEKTLKAVLTVARNFESAQKDIKASDRDFQGSAANKGSSNNAKANAVKAKGNQPSGNGGARPKAGPAAASGTNEKLRDELRRKNLCFRCGQDREHRPNGTCTAKDRKCSKCGTMGHIAKTCLQGGKAKSNATFTKAVAQHMSYANAVIGRPASRSPRRPVNAQGQMQGQMQGLGPANRALGRSAPLLQGTAAVSRPSSVASDTRSHFSVASAPAIPHASSKATKTLCGRKTAVTRVIDI